MYESGSGFIVHFFRRNTVEHLAKGFDILSIAEFEEGTTAEKTLSGNTQKERSVRASIQPQRGISENLMRLDLSYPPRYIRARDSFLVAVNKMDEP